MTYVALSYAAFLFQINQLRAEMENIDMKVTERNIAHNEELVLRDGLISKQETDIRVMEDKVMRLQQQVRKVCYIDLRGSPQ